MQRHLQIERKRAEGKLALQTEDWGTQPVQFALPGPQWIESLQTGPGGLFRILVGERLDLVMLPN
jgi:hypothetical protein